MASAYHLSVGAEIRRLLEDRDRSQAELARALGWDPNYLSRRLAGKISPSLADIEAIAAALDVPRSQILNAPLPMVSDRLAG